MSIVQNKTQLRKQLRQARRSLTPVQQADASENLLAVIRPLLKRQRTSRIALYLAMDGEIDLTPVISTCLQWKIDVYLPVLHKFQPTLWFARYDESSILTNNKFGIPEPLQSDPIRPWQLNMVLLPLVGFDSLGGRLGMGGGFYDQTFAHAGRWPKKPRLMGVAHECQKVDKIPLESWDISLDGIISDERIYLADKTRK